MMHRNLFQYKYLVQKKGHVIIQSNVKFISLELSNTTVLKGYQGYDKILHLIICVNLIELIDLME